MYTGGNLSWGMTNSFSLGLKNTTWMHDLKRLGGWPVSLWYYFKHLLTKHSVPRPRGRSEMTVAPGSRYIPQFQACQGRDAPTLWRKCALNRN